YEAYKRWWEDTGEHALTQRRIGLSLVERGFIHSHERTGWGWQGLRLRLPGEPVTDWLRLRDGCDGISNIAPIENSASRSNAQNSVTSVTSVTHPSVQSSTNDGELPW